MSELDEVKRQLAWAEGQLRARDIADAEAKRVAMEAAQKTQDETANAERQKALDTEIELTRHGAWISALLKNAVETNPTAAFDVNAFEKSIPAKGWPPGVSESDYHFAGQTVFGSADDDVANTTLGKMLGELTARDERIRRAG